MPFGTALGGAERYLGLVARRAAAHDLDMHVVFFERGPFEESLRADGVSTSVLPLGRFRDLRAGARVVRGLVRLIRRQRPDVVFGWLPRAQIYMSPAARLAGVPGGHVAWWQHHATTGEIHERVATLIPAAAVFVASRTVEEAQRRLRPRRRTVLTHYGIEPVDPRPDDEIAALREHLGIPAGRPVAGLPGRLVRWKGQDRFLEAVARLRDQGREIHALVVGGSGHGLDEGFDGELRELSRRLGIEDRVTFTGHVDEPLPYLQAMDVLVNASDPEPFGLTLVEAQALGVPALAVGRGGPTEIIEHGQSGWLVPSGDPADLAAGVAALLDDPELAAGIRERGRASYQRRFTADAGVARFAGALRDLAGSRPG
jgi:glycosyltransferase involved in cell wall biosynthesis